MMGQNLVTGIIQDITVKKRRIGHGITIDIIVEKLKEEQNIDLNCYDFSEDAESYNWTIQPRMLEGNFVKFLEVQASMYSGEEIQRAINAVREFKTGDQLIALAAEKNFENFQLVNHLSDYVHVNHENFTLEYSMIAFFVDGKILMECYGHILNYFEKTIRLQRSQYPVVDCIKVMITD